MPLLTAEKAREAVKARLPQLEAERTAIQLGKVSTQIEMAIKFGLSSTQMDTDLTPTVIKVLERLGYVVTPPQGLVPGTKISWEASP